MLNQLIFFVRDYWIQVLSTILISYFLGSINFSIIITRIVLEGKDIRSMGSGNAGFTNVLRSIGKIPAILTMAGDLSKCFIAVFIGKFIFSGISGDFSNPYVIIQYGAYLAGVFCLLGHMYPCFFKFKGGKAVLSAAAMICVIDWRILCIVLGLFLILFFVTKIVSFSAICAAISYPFATFLITFFLDYYPNRNQPGSIPLTYVIVTTSVALFVGVIVTYKHRSNIKRLLNGTEKKITAHKK